MEYLIKTQTTSTVLHADEELRSNPILLCSVQCDNIIVISHLVYFMQLHIHTSTQSHAHTARLWLCKKFVHINRITDT